MSASVGGRVDLALRFTVVSGGRRCKCNSRFDVLVVASGGQVFQGQPNPVLFCVYVNPNFVVFLLVC